MCAKPFSFSEFFKDTPWLNVPTERQAVFIAPLYPRGGLLGGSSDGAPKMSKLQALAAARKKKALEQRSDGASEVERPMAGLSLTDQATGPGAGIEGTKATAASKKPSRGFPLRKRKDSNPHEKPLKAPVQAEMPSETSEDAPMSNPPLHLDPVEPSAFASTMFSSRGHPPLSHQANLFTLPYTAAQNPASTNPFAGPSPDDIVRAAQSKGSTKFF